MKQAFSITKMLNAFVYVDNKVKMFYNKSIT